MISLSKTQPPNKIRLSKIDRYDTPKIYIHENSAHILGESYLSIPILFYKLKYKHIIKSFSQQTQFQLTIQLSFIDKESFQCLFLLCKKLHQYASNHSKKLNIDWWYHEEQHDWAYELSILERQHLITLIQEKNHNTIKNESLSEVLSV